MLNFIRISAAMFLYICCQHLYYLVVLIKYLAR